MQEKQASRNQSLDFGQGCFKWMWHSTHSKWWRDTCYTWPIFHGIHSWSPKLRVISGYCTMQQNQASRTNGYTLASIVSSECGTTLIPNNFGAHVLNRTVLFTVFYLRLTYYIYIYIYIRPSTILLEKVNTHNGEYCKPPTPSRNNIP